MSDPIRLSASEVEILDDLAEIIQDISTAEILEEVSGLLIFEDSTSVTIDDNELNQDQREPQDEICPSADVSAEEILIPDLNTLG